MEEQTTTPTANGASSELTAYDTMPYPMYSFPATHPARTAAIARMFGVDAAPPSQARVLELACAQGTNIMAMAQIYPQAQFIGIDMSRKQIEEGLDILASTKLPNVRLIQADISKINEDLGQFDYIIAHGLFAWVPDFVQDAILRLCRDHLKENGVAYISYNCLPGWRMRGAVRDMMLMHTRTIEDMPQKVAQARALLKFLAEACDENQAYGKHLRGELELLSRCDDSYIAHEFLEDENKPLYFVDFLQKAAQFHLQYLGEAELSTMLVNNLPPKAAETLQSLNLPQIDLEQYMDFVRNRMFRATLLVHADRKIRRNVPVECQQELRAVSLVTPVSNDPPEDGKPDTFRFPNGFEISLNDPYSKAMLRRIWQGGQHAVACSEAVEAGLSAAPPPAGLSPEGFREQLQTVIFQWAFKRVIDLSLGASNERHASGPHPESLPLTRWQASRGLKLSNQRLEMLPSDPFANKLIQGCDGSRDLLALRNFIAAAVEAGEFNINDNNKPIKDPVRLRDAIALLIHNTLPRLHALGLMALPQPTAENAPA